MGSLSKPKFLANRRSRRTQRTNYRVLRELCVLLFICFWESTLAGALGLYCNCLRGVTFSVVITLRVMSNQLHHTKCDGYLRSGYLRGVFRLAAIDCVFGDLTVFADVFEPHADAPGHSRLLHRTRKQGQVQYCSARFLKLVFWHSS